MEKLQFSLFRPRGQAIMSTDMKNFFWVMLNLLPVVLVSYGSKNIFLCQLQMSQYFRQFFVLLLISRDSREFLGLTSYCSQNHGNK